MFIFIFSFLFLYLFFWWKRILTKITTFWTVSKFLFLLLDTKVFRKKKRFCEKLILKPRVKENVHSLGLPIPVSATANVRGTHALMLWKVEKRKTIKLFRQYIWISQHWCTRNLKIHLRRKCCHDIVKLVLAKFE